MIRTRRSVGEENKKEITQRTKTKEEKRKRRGCRYDLKEKEEKITCGKVRKKREKKLREKGSRREDRQYNTHLLPLFPILSF